MANPTLVQVKAVSGGIAASQALQFTSRVAKGDTIIVTVRWYNDPLSVGISDTEGNSYQLIASATDDGYNTCQIWQAVNVVGDVSTPDTITITNITSGGAYCRINALEYSPCQFPLSTPWTRFTSVITPNIHDLNGGNAWNGNQCGPVLYETGSQCGLGSGSIFKMWFQGADDICYAESVDGVTWVRYTGAANGVVIAGYGSMRIWKESGTYYMFCSPYFTDNTHIYLFSSTDGVTWSPHGTILAATGSGWESVFFHFCVIDNVSGTYYALYDGHNAGTGYYATGLATATSLSGPWTKYGSNPVLTNPVSGVGVTPTGAFLAKKIGSTYYIWFQSVVPGNAGTLGNSDIWQATSTDLINFTLSQSTPVFNRMLLSEGAGQANGQVADASIVEVGGTTFVWYTATPNGYVGKNYAINLAKIPQALSSVLTTPVVEILPAMTYTASTSSTAVAPASITTTAEAAVVMTEFTFNSQSGAPVAGGGGTLESNTPTTFDTGVFEDIGGAATYSLTATLATGNSASFSIQLPFYSGGIISGNAGIAGATVSWSGATSGSVTADGSGNYTLPSLSNGMYTITPSKTGYTFSPDSSSEIIINGNITPVNFTATLQGEI